jgi:hypothetical protein
VTPDISSFPGGENLATVIYLPVLLKIRNEPQRREGHEIRNTRLKKWLEDKKSDITQLTIYGNYCDSCVSSKMGKY